ncbi:hypothetical protein Lal_00039931 [Lupinus albus]|nr:hypothetical protein Lal_00039931 [Lupinus albus]
MICPRSNIEKVSYFSLTLSVSTNNSKFLDFLRIGSSQIEMILSTLHYFGNTRTQLYGYVKYRTSNPSRKRGETDTQFQIPPFLFMSWRGSAEEKTAKSDHIFCNRLVNILVNRILKHTKKITGLSNYLSSYEKDLAKDRNKSTICFTSRKTWSNSRYSSKSCKDPISTLEIFLFNLILYA